MNSHVGSMYGDLTEVVFVLKFQAYMAHTYISISISVSVMISA